MENFKSIFSESYHSMYCRAKSIIDKEEDVIALMKEVYLLAAESNVADINATSWMAKQTYILGCGKFRKKKAREAELIELQEQEYETQKGTDCGKTKELICETLAELPDLYQATLFALYYDQYSIKDVAAITGYSEGVVINRLNYIHKYLSKKLEDYQEENKVKVQFSVELVYEALKEWVAENTLDETMLQNLYTSLCMELNLPVENLFKEDAGESEAQSEEQPEPKLEVADDGRTAVKEELQVHSVKSGLDKKQVLLVAAIVGGLAVLALIAILLLGNSDKKDEPKGDKAPVEEQEKESGDTEDVQADNSQEDNQDEDTQSDNSQEDNQDEDIQSATDSTYILPNSNTKRLTRDDLKGLSKEELRLARNEIFARHGMIFGVADLDAYFGEKSWYKPTVAYDDFYDKVEMSMIEEANLVLISQVEEELQ